MNSCYICNQKLKPKLIAHSNHLFNHHSDITKQEYYDKYLKKAGDGLCKICGEQTKWMSFGKGYSQHCSRTCAVKTQWLGNIDRREILISRMQENTFGKGRPKGAKNILPWSLEARARKSIECIGRSAPHNKRPDKIKKHGEIRAMNP